MWRHPKYYKELRKLRNNSDQVISDEASTEATSVHPGPGLSGKQQAASDSQVVNQVKLSSQSQAASTSKLQATSTSKRQATSEGKLQATSSKRQASE